MIDEKEKEKEMMEKKIRYLSRRGISCEKLTTRLLDQNEQDSSFHQGPTKSRPHYRYFRFKRNKRFDKKNFR